MFKNIFLYGIVSLLCISCNSGSGSTSGSENSCKIYNQAVDDVIKADPGSLMIQDNQGIGYVKIDNISNQDVTNLVYYVGDGGYGSAVVIDNNSATACANIKAHNYCILKLNYQRPSSYDFDADMFRISIRGSCNIFFSFATIDVVNLNNLAYTDHSLESFKLFNLTNISKLDNSDTKFLVSLVKFNNSTRVDNNSFKFFNGKKQLKAELVGGSNNINYFLITIPKEEHNELNIDVKSNQQIVAKSKITLLNPESDVLSIVPTTVNFMNDEKGKFFVVNHGSTIINTDSLKFEFDTINKNKFIVSNETKNSDSMLCVKGTKLAPNKMCMYYIEYKDKDSDNNKNIVFSFLKITDGQNQKVTSLQVNYLGNFPWYLRKFVATNIVGDNFINAWSLLKKEHVEPGDGVTVAVLDSGYTPHNDFKNNLILPGYKVFSDCFNSIDITNPDDIQSKLSACEAEAKTNKENNSQITIEADGQDTGDYVPYKNFCPNKTKDALNSSWHGTAVTGLIVGKAFDRKEGVVGGAYNAKVIPARVAGRCGFFNADLLYMLNFLINQNSDKHKINVINLSLGGYNSSGCTRSMQEIIDIANQKNIIVVNSAGNETKDIATHFPSKCKGVISVAALGQNNIPTYYTNYGDITIAASGGEIRNTKQTQGIYTTSWASKNKFIEKDGESHKFVQGTSFAAPLVSAAIADMISLMNKYGICYDYKLITQILQNTGQKLTSNYYNDEKKSLKDNIRRINVEAAINYIIQNKKTLKERCGNHQ